MREISEDELNKNIDKYFKIAESENIIVSLENKMYDYEQHLVVRTPRACPWEQSENYNVNKIKQKCQ